jgi:hypothetical protein
VSDREHHLAVLDELAEAAWRTHATIQPGPGAWRELHRIERQRWIDVTRSVLNAVGEHLATIAVTR